MSRQSGHAAEERTDPVLETRDVVVGYDGIAVTQPLSLEVGGAEIVCLLGPNGAGKTSTLLTISGMMRPISGTVVYDGRDLRGVAPDARARAGIVQVPEDRALFTTLTVTENLRAAGADDDDIARVFEFFPSLRRIGGRHASVLSGGEQQMLALARALVLRPRLLIVDEMSLGLAPLVVESILPIFRRIVDETGASVLMVEQHVHLALEVADRAYVMVRGRLVGEGPANEVAGSLDELRSHYLGADRARSDGAGRPGDQR